MCIRDRSESQWCRFSEIESVPGPSGTGSVSHRARHLGRSVLGVTRRLAGRQPTMQTGGIGVHAIHDVELLPMFVGDTGHVALELDGQRCGDVLALVECGLGHLGPPPQGAVRFLQYVSGVAGRSTPASGSFTPTASPANSTPLRESCRATWCLACPGESTAMSNRLDPTRMASPSSSTWSRSGGVGSSRPYSVSSNGP